MHHGKFSRQHYKQQRADVYRLIYCIAYKVLFLEFLVAFKMIELNYLDIPPISKTYMILNNVLRDKDK